MSHSLSPFLYKPLISSLTLHHFPSIQIALLSPHNPKTITKMPSSSSPVAIVARSTVKPDRPSSLGPLQLSVSDICMLSCHYIQKGVLLPNPPSDFSVRRLSSALSAALSHFPALAGRFSTDPDGRIWILCNDAGVDFVHAAARGVSAADILPSGEDIPGVFREFFAFDWKVSYSGHEKPLVAVQVTELAGGVFIGVTMNHAVADGTSFWHFFNTFAEIHRNNSPKISISPDFCRDTVFNSPAVLRFAAGGPTVTFSADEPLRERIFHFSRESILKLKFRANHGVLTTTEICGKKNHDGWKSVNGDNGKITEISSFQSLSAQLWRSVTRARNLPGTKTTTFRMAVNCRHRLEPRLDPHYFGNAIQSIPTTAPAEVLLAQDLGWGAGLLRRNVAAHGDATVRRGIMDWEGSPRLFPLGNADGASITMGSSPRFPMYNNDFGWGRPEAVRSGRANKFDGKISAFPGRDGNGSVDLEVVLAPQTMAGLQADPEFMQYVS